jgi:hypothetical protein
MGDFPRFLANCEKSSQVLAHTFSQLQAFSQFARKRRLTASDTSACAFKHATNSI